jgi:peptidoglycan/xylan/chitin deacetylase (PgdA/CDA1 family)
VSRHERSSARRRDRRLAALLGVLCALALAALVAIVTRGSGSAKGGTTPPVAAAPEHRARPAHPVAPAPRRHALTLPARPAREAVRVPVLMFHRVAPRALARSETQRSLTVEPSTFAAELDWIAVHGYHPITQEQLFLGLFDGARLPRRPVVLSFDDGYKDDVRTILPMLRRHGWPATFFVITGRDALPDYLSWPEIRTLDRAGMDLGSHTVDHTELLGLAPARLRWELVTSRDALERHLGHPIRWFAYPAGRYDATSENAVATAGYLLAYGTRPGSRIAAGSRLAEPRVRVDGGESASAFGASLSAAEGA